MSDDWKSFRVKPDEGNWEPASYNVKWQDGREYGRWRRVLRRHSHGLTVISRYTAPPGKAGPRDRARRSGRASRADMTSHGNCNSHPPFLSDALASDREACRNSVHLVG